MTRPMSNSELNALSAYLPEDLTEDQLEGVLQAAKYACEEAHKEGAFSATTTSYLRKRVKK